MLAMLAPPSPKVPPRLPASGRVTWSCRVGIRLTQPRRPALGRQRRCAIPAGGGEGRQGRRRKEEEDSGYKEAASFIHSLCPGKRFPGDAAQRCCSHRMQGV